MFEEFVKTNTSTFSGGMRTSMHQYHVIKSNANNDAIDSVTCCSPHKMISKMKMLAKKTNPNQKRVSISIKTQFSAQFKITTTKDKYLSYVVYSLWSVWRHTFNARFISLSISLQKNNNNNNRKFFALTPSKH